jgi:hypothetical protein
VLQTRDLLKGHNLVVATYTGDTAYSTSRGWRHIYVVAQAPDAPSLTSAQATDSAVALQWSAATSGAPAATFNVYRSTSSDDQGSAIVTGLVDPTYTDLTAENGTPYFYEVTAVNAVGESSPSNALSAEPPSSSASATPCDPDTTCVSPTVGSDDGSTALQATSSAIGGPQTLTVQVGGLTPMFCTLPDSGSVVSEYQVSDTSAGVVADYTVFGDAATFADNFYTENNDDVSGCYGSPVPFNGWSPDETGTWEDGPYVYGSVPFDEGTGLYEGFLGNCENHDGYQPCFTNSSGDGVNTTEIHTPPECDDPRVSH